MTKKNYDRNRVHTSQLVEAAMRELEKKSKLFTEAHKGETSEEILAEMRSEYLVSEELREAARKYFKSLKDGCFIRSDIILAFKAGANWQSEQFEKNRLKHCDTLTEEQAQIESDFVTHHLKENNRTPTFIDAIEYGKKLQKAQMMADAIDVEVKMDAGGYPYIDKTMELYDYDKNVPLANGGDKVKVIVIKEEKQ